MVQANVIRVKLRNDTDFEALKMEPYIATPGKLISHTCYTKL